MLNDEKFLVYVFRLSKNHKEIIDYNKSKSGGTFIYKDNVDEETRGDLQQDFFELRRNTNRINQVRERIKQKAKNKIVKSIKVAQ